jgi:hypothetical protein
VGSKILVFFYFCSSFSGPDGETKSLPNQQKTGKTQKSIPKKQTNCIFIVSLFLFLKKREKILKNWRIEKCQESKKNWPLRTQVTTLSAWLTRRKSCHLHASHADALPRSCTLAREACRCFTQSLHDMLQQWLEMLDLNDEKSNI